MKQIVSFKFFMFLSRFTLKTIVFMSFYSIFSALTCFRKAYILNLKSSATTYPKCPLQKGAALAATAAFPRTVPRPMGSCQAKDMAKPVYLSDDTAGAYLSGLV